MSGLTSRLSDLHLRIQKDIRQHRLLERGQRILLAVSGGQDSLCLLKVLQDLSCRWQWELFVLHCDHRWTPEETTWAQTLQQWVTDQGLPCAIETAETITLDENRARQWRYQSMQHWAMHWDCPVVATGHTGSDRAETLLFNLLRGSGPQGFVSLAWKRPLHAHKTASPLLVRPLLATWRQETAAFCQKHQLPVWQDPFNQDLSHARCRLRQEVIPYLKTHLNPQVEAALSRSATLLAAEHEFVTLQAAQIWPQVYDRDPPRLYRPVLRNHHIALQRQIIFSFLCHHLPRAPRYAQVEEVQQLLTAPRRSKTSPFPGGTWVEVTEDWLVWQKPL
jgi:tRNA(Ile)-lysidine synthase